MKQADLNKMLNAALRQSAKAHEWQFSRGFVYKATDLLFFSIIILGQVRQRYLSYSVNYKLLAFDDLFWKIVKTEENLKQPLSFRAFGAWTAPMTTLSSGELPIAGWNPGNLQIAVKETIALCKVHAEKVAEEIEGLDDNLRVIEGFYVRLKEQYPDAVTNIWRERLLTSILKGAYQDAERIVRDRISSHDSGGFQVGNKSFYDLANEYLEKVL